MALTNARDILNKKILGTGGGGVPSADEIPIDIPGLSATKLSVGLEEIVLDIDQLSTSILTISGKVENLEDAAEYSTTEHVVGKWIDGSDVYEITVDNENISVSSTSSFVDTSLDATNVERILSFDVYDVSNSFYSACGAVRGATGKFCFALTNLVGATSRDIKGYTIRYTKKTPPVETRKRTTKKK